MAETTHIEWCDSTWNPWEGCQKTGSPGCDGCYAEARNARFGGGTAKNWGPKAPRRRTSESNWKLPGRWNANAAAFHSLHGRRQRVFCASLADWLDNAVPAEWRRDMLRIVFRTNQLDWLLLSKRIGNLVPLLKEVVELVDPVEEKDFWLWLQEWASGEKAPENVSIGVTVVNQPEADRDVTKLLTTPAARRFLSLEPLLGPINLRNLAAPTTEGHTWHGIDALSQANRSLRGVIDWVIVGGESGPHARAVHPEWVRDIRDQCQASETPFMFKQWGGWIPINQMHEYEHTKLYKSRVKAKPHQDQGTLDDIYGRRCTVPTQVIHIDGSSHDIKEPMAFLQGTEAMQTFKVGKEDAGRRLDGRTWDEVPA